VRAGVRIRGETRKSSEKRRRKAEIGIPAALFLGECPSEERVFIGITGVLIYQRPMGGIESLEEDCFGPMKALDRLASYTMKAERKQSNFLIDMSDENRL